MNERLSTILGELRQELDAFYGERLKGVLLFGSQARGDAAEESDIDVLVVLEGEVDASREISRTGHIVAEVSLKHDVVISWLFMSEQRYAAEQSSLLTNIRREGVAV